MTADHIDRAAEVLSKHWRSMHTNESLGQQRMLARALDAAGLLVTTEHDAAVAAKAWRQGFTTGQSRAMRHMSDEPMLPLSAPNPYEREAGESDADA